MLLVGHAGPRAICRNNACRLFVPALTRTEYVLGKMSVLFDSAFSHHLGAAIVIVPVSVIPRGATWFLEICTWPARSSLAASFGFYCWRALAGGVGPGEVGA